MQEPPALDLLQPLAERQAPGEPALVVHGAKSLPDAAAEAFKHEAPNQFEHELFKQVGQHGAG